MLPASLRRSILRCSISPCLVLAFVGGGAPGASLAAEPSPAELFGVDLGTPLSVVKSLAAGATACREFGAPPKAIACQAGLGQVGRLGVDSTTFWLSDGRVARAFAPLRLGSRSYDQCKAAFTQRVSQVEASLGRPPTETTDEPSWVRTMDDGGKLFQVAQGRLMLKASWRLADRVITVGLHGDKGVPVLVIGLEATGPIKPRCSDRQVAALLMDLFPPASAQARTAAAQGLAACRVERAAGALAAAAGGSSEPEVRVEAVRALGSLGPGAKPQLEAIAGRGKQDQAAVVARDLLGRLEAPRDAGAVASTAGVATHAGSAAGEVAARRGEGATPVASKPASAPAVAAPALPPRSEAASAHPPVAVAPSPAEAATSGGAAVAVPGAPATTATAPAPAAPTPSPAPEAREPEPPKGPPDGTALALTTSLVAGGVWGAGLSLLAQQNSTSVLFLVGSAGAVIGGGTAWGLTHFGLRPSPSQALWFTNSTAWGTLAGLAAWAGSGSDNVKLKWGLLVGGESLGMGMGVLGARLWDWRPTQVLLANTLVLGAGLTGGGAGMLLRPNSDFHISPLAGFAAVPVMAASAVASRYLDVSGNDLHLLAASALASGFTGGLLGYGLDTNSSTRDDRLAGGFLAGMGVGYLGAAALSPFVEVAPCRLWLSSAGMLAGNVIGLGSHMMAAPGEPARRSLAASLGGLGLGVGAFLAYPRLRIGEQAQGMALIGAAYGAGSWALATALSDEPSQPRLQGGLLALGTAGALGGLLGSGYFHPTEGDYILTLSSAALGASAGIGVARLSSAHTGRGELAGTLAGSAAGFATGAAFSHYSRLRAPDLGAAMLGGGYGALVGALAPTLLDVDWGGGGRRQQGGLLVGLPAGAFAGAALAHGTQASGVTVAVASAGAVLGLGMGAGTGLLWPEHYAQPARVGIVAGLSAGMVGALLLERPLRLDRGLGPAAFGLGGMGVAIGLTQGILLAGLVDPSGQPSQTSSRQLWGGGLLGGSAGLATGLLLSNVVAPSPRQLAVTGGGGLFGGLFGRGLAMTLSDRDGRGDTAATMAGIAGGTAALALAERLAPLTNIDLAAGTVGFGYGAVVGALAPTLGDADWGGWRRATQGGLLLGMGAGALGGVALGHLAHAAPADVAVASSGALLGLGMGAGTGLLWRERFSQPTRIGAVAGLSAGMLGGLLLERPLQLDQGLGEAAIGLGIVGAGLGVVEGVLLAGLVDPSGQVGRATDQQIAGGALLGGSAGLATGLALSRYFMPGPRNLVVTVGGGVLGGMLGRGMAMTIDPREGRGDAAGTLAGVAAGSAALALAEHFSPLDDLDFAGATAGLASGGLVGTLAPTLGSAEWGGWRRTTHGGLLLGVGGGALAGMAVRHATGAQPATLMLASAGGVLGLGMGVGTGLLWPEAYSQPARIGAVAGVTAGMAGALALARPLRLSEGLGPSAPGLAVTGVGLGVAEGILLAALIDPSGDVSQTSGRQLRGGALLGGSAGLASGLLLSRYFQPSSDELLVTTAGALAGGTFGRGLAMSLLASDGRRDTAGTLAGALAGTASLAIAERRSPLTPTDGAAATLGLAYGGMVGALVPTLADSRFGGWRRATEGGLLLGLSGGALGAAGLSHATGVSTRTLGMGFAGALDGAVTGAGIGLLVDREPKGSQGARVGLVAGATGGLVLGLAWWPRLVLDEQSLLFVSALSAVGGWTGGWAQALGHASLDDVPGQKAAGGVMAGAGAGVMLATGLLPTLRVDPDLMGNALATDVIFSGAGAGIGMLVSGRDDAAVMGMLGAGTAGLLLGGVLHESIDFERARGLLALGGLEGLWAGAWLPYVLKPRGEVTTSDNVAGLAAGGLGGFGLSLLASTVVTTSPAGMGMAAAGSAIGASLAGGSVLLSDELRDRRGVGIMLGSTAAGLGLGALTARWIPLDGRRGLHLLGGASFGLAEGLAFAWAGRASGQRELAGSALVGAGLGATLGLASTADSVGLDTQQALVASGFAAWGGWVGSFAGALAKADPHEVVLGGLATANLGFAAGYGALRYDWVAPRDFGWLSLGGAMGAALGGGIGAVFSTRTDPAPVLAGLSIGPVVGIGVSAILVPRLRHRGETQSAWTPPTTVAGVRFDLPSSETEQRRTSTDVLAERKPGRFLPGLRRLQRHLFDVTNWTPVFGSLPPPPGDPNPAPFFMGISGGLR